jgi:cell division septation protein DedD
VTTPATGTTAQKPSPNTKSNTSSGTMAKPPQGSGMDANTPLSATPSPAIVAKPINPQRPTRPDLPPAATPTPTTPSRSQFLSNYRVAVGSFSTQSRANTAAARIRAQGLPAVAVPSGGMVVVVVGPYTTEAAAQNALKQLSGNYPDAVLYRPNGTRSRAGTPTRPSTPPASNPPPASSSNAAPEGAYLQVGAFNSSVSATPVLTQLRRVGYPAQLRSSPDGLTRVLVGPLSADTLGRVRSELRRRGYSPFTVTR